MKEISLGDMARIDKILNLTAYQLLGNDPYIYICEELYYRY